MVLEASSAFVKAVPNRKLVGIKSLSSALLYVIFDPILEITAAKANSEPSPIWNKSFLQYTPTSAATLTPGRPSLLIEDVMFPDKLEWINLPVTPSDNPSLSFLE